MLKRQVLRAHRVFCCIHALSAKVGMHFERLDIELSIILGLRARDRLQQAVEADIRPRACDIADEIDADICGHVFGTPWCSYSIKPKAGQSEKSRLAPSVRRRGERLAVKLCTAVTEEPPGGAVTV